MIKLLQSQIHRDFDKTNELVFQLKFMYHVRSIYEMDQGSQYIDWSTILIYLDLFYSSLVYQVLISHDKNVSFNTMFKWFMSFVSDDK